MTRRKKLILIIIAGAVLLALGVTAAVLLHSIHGIKSSSMLSNHGEQSLHALSGQGGKPDAAGASPECASLNSTNDLYAADQKLEGVSVGFEYESRGVLKAEEYPSILEATGENSVSYTIAISLPKLTANSADVSVVNEEITENFQSVINLKDDDALLLEKNTPSVQNYYVRYFVAQTPKTVSIVLCSTVSYLASETVDDCSVYNFEKSSWKRISPQELLKLNGMDAELTAKMYEQKNKAPDLKNPKCPDYYIDGKDVWGLFPQNNGVSRVKLTTDQESDQQYLSVLDTLIKRHTYLTDHLFSSGELIKIPNGARFDANAYYPVTSSEFSSMAAFKEYIHSTYTWHMDGYYPLSAYMRSLHDKNPPLYEESGTLMICKGRSPRYADNAALDFSDYSAKILDFVDDSVYFEVSLYQLNSGTKILVKKQISITYENECWKISGIA